MRRVALLLVIAVAGLAGADAASVAASSPVPHRADAAAKHKKKRANRRRGGKVRVAWPRGRYTRPPRKALARWLAKQVGPVRAKKHKRRRARAAGPIATPAQVGSGTGTSTGLSTSGSGTLWLVRSFDIPKSDPAYGRLANYSWTYDNALATFAFISVGARTPAEEV